MTLPRQPSSAGGPRSIGSVVSRLLAHTGYDQEQVASGLATAWDQAAPEGFRPPAAELERAKPWVTVHDRPESACEGAHFVHTDVWTSMGQEAENATRLRAFAGYTVTRELMALAHPDARVMHCLPAHRGEEITDDVLEGAQSLVFTQAENRLHVQKALLLFLLT